MDNTIILAQLSKTIAELTGCTVADAENFVRELFILAAERLESDAEVYIPEIGSFKLTDNGVEFAPDSDLAAAINAPFAAFEAVELPADMDFENDVENMSQASEVVEDDEPAIVVDEPESVAEPDIESPSEEVVQPEAIATYDSNDEAPAEVMPEVAVEPNPEPEPHAKGQPKSRLIIWLIIACILSFVAGWYAGRYQLVEQSETDAPDVAEIEIPSEPISTTQEADSVNLMQTFDVPADVEINVIPEAQPVITDTIAPGRFLTTMAREHYNQMDYWVYIYEENAANLGHPDRLSAGTVVVIPPADKYGLIPGDAVKISEASRLATEIYARFN